MTRRFVSIAILGATVILIAAGCSKDKTVLIERYTATLSEAGLAGQRVSQFTIPLTGAEAGVTTTASGTATLTLGKSSIDYTIELNNIGTSVQTVILNIGDPGTEGVVAGTMFVGNEAGPINGVLTEGTLTAEQLQGFDFGRVVDTMRAGRAYVLVGTTDFPSGELRGQTGPRGQARFVLEGSTITWVVEGQIITGVTSMGIYSGGVGVNGQKRVSLFDAEPTGTINGRIASGEFGESDINGLALSDLLAQMNNGSAYVLVSTSERPDGKMRGQIYLQF